MKIYDSNNRDITDLVEDTDELIKRLDKEEKTDWQSYAEFEEIMFNHGYDGDPIEILDALV